MPYRRGSGSIVDAIFSVGRDGALDLSKRHVNFTSLHFPDMMEERGFPEVRASLGLSGQGGSQLDWKFRDDGYSLWGALARYMEAVVVRIYTSDLALARDTALQVNTPLLPWLLLDCLCPRGGLKVLARRVTCRASPPS